MDHMREKGVRGAPLKSLDQAWWEYLEVVTRENSPAPPPPRDIIDGTGVEPLQSLLAKLNEI